MALSDLQIGYIRREIDEILNFVPGPAPRREVELVEWCRNACGADTVREVADEWARLVIRFGSTLFHSDLAEAVRRNRPTVLRSIIQDLDSIEDQTIAILCTAVDSAESEQIFGRIEAAQRIKPKGETDAERESRETLEEEQFAADNERAAELSGDEWEIPNFLRI